MIVDRPEWHERAACCGMTDWFDVPPGGPGLASAQNHAAVTERLAVCATCTEHVPCALLGLERTNVGTGVWAGVYVPPKKGRVEAFRRLAAVAGVEPPRRPPGTLPAPCGTNAAYFRHRRDGEDACEPCKQAHALAKAERERARLQRARDAAPRRHAGGIVSHPAGTILGAEFSAGGPGHQISAMTTHAHNTWAPPPSDGARGPRSAAKELTSAQAYPLQWRRRADGGRAVRNHARILTAIWADEDFRSLDQAAQHAYLMLLSQPKLSMVGVIDHMPARWAGYTAGVSKAQMERAIATLEAARFVIVDRSEMELLVRTVVKHDPARSWQTRIAMWNAWGAVASDALRAAILRELPPDMWTDEKAPPPTKALALRDAAPHDASDTPSDALSDSDRVLPSPSSFLLPPSPSSYNGSGIGHPQAVDNTTTDDPDPISVHDAGRGVVASLRGAP